MTLALYKCPIYNNLCKDMRQNAVWQKLKGEPLIIIPGWLSSHDRMAKDSQKLHLGIEWPGNMTRVTTSSYYHHMDVIVSRQINHSFKKHILCTYLYDKLSKESRIV